MLLAHKIELYVTPEQASYLDRAMGTRRHCWNQLLAYFKEPGRKWSKKEAYRVYKLLRKEFAWYAEVSGRASRNVIDDLDAGFQRFFKWLKGGKKGRRVGFPRFKSKGSQDSFALREAEKFAVLGGRYLRIEKLKTTIKMSQKLRFDGKTKQVTISKSAEGKYYASILVETEGYTKTCGEGIVGVDVGVKDMAVLSDGTTFPANQKLKASLRTLAKRQRKLAKKQRGSNRRARAKLAVARIYARVARQRAACLHQISDYVTSNFEVIVIEDLNVAGMLRNRKLARAIADASPGELCRQIEYKAKLRGGTVIVADRFFPSTKTCSSCGSKQEIKLSQRTYRCGCGLEIDRDLNAAINLRKYGEDTLRPTEGSSDPQKRTQEPCKATAPREQRMGVDGVNGSVLDQSGGMVPPPRRRRRI